MPATVYFIDLKTSHKENFPEKLCRLMETAGLSKVVRPRDLVALKLHFGELGNTAFIRPVFIGRMAAAVREKKGVPFLTDTTTLYTGSRRDAPRHLQTAIANGFAYSVVGAPIVIADGLRGNSHTSVEINQEHFKNAYIGNEIVQADALISAAHFTGHELAGFGGTLKNLGMGCASRRGKLAQHSNLSPKVKRKKCIGCGDCIAHCAHNAIALVEEKAIIDPEICIGCGECILICPQKAPQVQWDQSIPVFMEKMVEYTLAVLQGKKGKALFVNFITDVSPACDCAPYCDTPLVRDIGVVAATDPVAVDQAAVDLINREPALSDACVTQDRASGDDKFRAVYPKIDWAHQLDYAEKIGLGTRRYTLEKL